MKNSKLFVYGQLKPGSKYEPKVLKKPVKAKIKADLYNLGKDAAVKNVGRSKSKAEGFVLDVPMKEEKSIAKMEKPQYKEVKTKTMKGEKVKVFEYKPSVKNKPKALTWKIK